MPATGETPERLRLYAELWTSFAALIGSYVAGHNLAYPVSNHAQVIEGEAGHLTLRGERRTLRLEMNPATGEGSWAIYEDESGSERVLERGRFEMSEDSQLTLSGEQGRLEMEAAAELFTAKAFD